MQDRFRPIPKDILDRVGLTEERLDAFRKANMEDLDSQLTRGKAQGKQLYKEGWIKIPYPTNRLNEINIFELSVERSPDILQSPKFYRAGVPDNILQLWEQKQESLKKFDVDKSMRERMKTFLADAIEGLAEHAFTEKDWDTAVNAYDAITEGGFENSQAIMAKINALPLDRTNYQDRKGIAEAMQRRAQEKARQQAADQSHPTPAKSEEL